MTEVLRHRLAVRFRDCDGLGHVNNAVYLTYLEQARFTLWRGQGLVLARPAADVGPRGLGVILARAEVDFRAQARFGDELDVCVRLAGFGRTSFIYEYDILQATSGEAVAAARTVQVRFDYDANRPAPLDDETRERLARPLGRVPPA